MTAGWGAVGWDPGGRAGVGGTGGWGGGWLRLIVSGQRHRHVWPPTMLVSAQRRSDHFIASDGARERCGCGVGGGLGWVGLGQGLTWSPTHGPRRLPCRTRLGGCTRVSGHKAYRTADRPQTPRWRSRAGDAAVPVCMCPCVSGGGGGCGTPACSIVVRRWRTWRGEVCAWCSRPRQGGWRA